MKLEEKIAKVIYKSSLWNCGKDSHHALSELTLSLEDLFKSHAHKLVDCCDTYAWSNCSGVHANKRGLFVRSDEISKGIENDICGR